MLSQSRIEVWYKVAGDRIHLGETSSDRTKDVLSLWVDLSFDPGSSKLQGYRVSLFDDDGRHIADKRISQSDAETVLRQKAVRDKCQSVHVNLLGYVVDNNGLDDLAFV